MPYGRRGGAQFYDPMIQPAALPEPPAPEPAEGATEVRPFLVTRPGLYLHVDDVTACLRGWAADQAPSVAVDYAEALLDAAAAFDAMKVGRE